MKSSEGVKTKSQDLVVKSSVKAGPPLIIRKED